MRSQTKIVKAELSQRCIHGNEFTLLLYEDGTVGERPGFKCDCCQRPKDEHKKGGMYD